MRRRQIISGTRNEHGIVILLVAVVLLFVVGAMAALAIDVATLYTARSEAQLAADGAALAGARVLANSGMTSSTDPNLATNAETLARNMATLVAQQNQVGGSTPTVTVTFSTVVQGNPHVTVKVSRNDLPTFFARIWGSKTITVAASATAEAYNASGAASIASVAPACVKPWLLPNISPTPAGGPIFQASGAIADPTLLGWSSVLPGTGSAMMPACGAGGDCSTLPPPVAWNYYPGDDATFPHPTRSLPTCIPALTSDYQESIAGCVETPIACNGTANIDAGPYPTRNLETADAVNCLTHAKNSFGDTITFTNPLSAPFQFVAGADNPITGAAGVNVMVSSSLVTVPVFDNGTGTALPTGNQIVGFVQLFLNPDGNATTGSGNVNATVINLVGCGTGAAGPPIYGNGASAVPVRLITPP